MGGKSHSITKHCNFILANVCYWLNVARFRELRLQLKMYVNSKANKSGTEKD